MIRALLALLLVFGVASLHAFEPLPYRDAAEEARFRALIAELRCVMCQSQSLADSNSMIAGDLRREVLDLMQQGKTDAEIKDFLVERYSEFVLYRPPLSPTTWLLWFAPAMILLGGGVVLARVLRRRAAALDPAAPRGPANQDTREDW